MSLAGKLYFAWASDENRRALTSIVCATPGGWEPDDDPHEAERLLWTAAPDAARRLAEEGEEALSRHLGPVVDRLLLEESIGSVEPSTRWMLLREAHAALLQALEVRKRNVEGDYRPDPAAARFPHEPIRAAPPAAARASITGLFEAWWKEAEATGRSRSTKQSYGSTIRAFVASLGHDDALRVSPEDVIRFKDDRLAQGRSPKTIKDSDLAALKTVFGWGVSNRKVPSNPAAGITLPRPKRVVVRPKSFTDEEATAILRAALQIAPGREKAKTRAAKRWAPWLLAYTGARVGEVAQLRKEDVVRRNGISFLRITPEAGTVKTKEARDVPLHPHLEELGFLTFVRDAPAGHLFKEPSEARGGIVNRIREFARDAVPDPRVSPTHGWRHRFKTVGRRLGLDPALLDALQGHAPRTEGESYGEFDLETRAAAVSRFPRYDVGRSAEGEESK